MKFLLKGFIALDTLFLLGVWLIWMISPETAKSIFEVDASSITGINSLKSEIGGLFLTYGVFLILFFVKGKQWLYSAAVALSCVMVTRTISLVVDGYTQPGVINLLIELVSVIIFVSVARQDSSDSSDSLPE